MKNTNQKKLAVFTGAAKGHNTVYRNTAKEFAHLLTQHEITLAYGGGGIGLMGELADVILENKGQIIGVMPQFLVDREIGHAGLTEMHIVNSMHERKALLAQMADGFVALPGGLGTLDELFEIWTWRRLHMHDKPVGLLNTNGYYNELLKFLDRMADEGFVSHPDRQLLIVEETPAALIKRFMQIWETTPTSATVTEYS